MSAGMEATAVRIDAGDVLIVYGREERVAEVDRRAHDQAGDHAHASAVAEQERVEAAEDAADHERLHRDPPVTSARR
jgi:hypothetical protein